jgi:putative heme-binding domain-containing protein
LKWLADHAAGNPFVADHIVPKAMRRLAADHLDACLRFAADLPDGPRAQALAGLAVALGDKTLSPPPGWAVLRDRFPTDPLSEPLAVAFRDPQAVARADAVLSDTSRPTAARTEAVRRLVRLTPPSAAPKLLRLIRDDRDVGVRVEAARQLAAVPRAAVTADLFAGWAELPPAVRAELASTLSGRKEWARMLLEAVKAGTVPRTELTDTHATKMQALKDKPVDDLLASAWGRTRPTPKELDATIAKMRDELAAGPGDFARGKAVFAAQCGKCHQFDGTGAGVGPALDGAGRDIEYILANVIDPNRVIGAPYFQRIVTLADGRVEQGLLHTEDDTSVTLKVENGVTKTFAKADLDGPIKVVERSLMPEGLAYGMGVQDFRDLVTYLMASPFPARVAVDGNPVEVPVSGHVPLPAGSGKPVIVEVTVTATAGTTTTLAVGSADPFTATLDGNPVGEGKGAGRRPDAEGFPVMLSPGDHTVRLTVKWSGRTPGVYVRLLDPDRKLSR